MRTLQFASGMHARSCCSCAQHESHAMGYIHTFRGVPICRSRTTSHSRVCIDHLEQKAPSVKSNSVLVQAQEVAVYEDSAESCWATDTCTRESRFFESGLELRAATGAFVVKENAEYIPILGFSAHEYCALPYSYGQHALHVNSTVTSSQLAVHFRTGHWAEELREFLLMTTPELRS